MAIVALFALASAYAENIDTAIAGFAERMGKALVAKGKTKLTVLDFADIEGRPTEFGRFLAEQLSVEFVNTAGILVVDRANLKSILAEHKLSEDGLINSDTAKKLGQFAGVDVIVLGTVTNLDDGYAVTVKGVATDTAEIVAAAKAMVAKTRETQQLGQRVIASASGSSAGARDSTHSAAIATKDFGDLRVALKSVQRTKKEIYRQTVDAIECRLDFANTNLKQSIACAGNGQNSNPDFVLAQLRTSSGDVLKPVEIRGLTSISVYGHGVSPAAIAQIIVSGKRIDGPRAYFPNERLWMGELTTIPAGETIQVAIVFAPEFAQRAPPVAIDSLHLDFEFVVGTGVRTTIGGGALPASARLCTLSFDGLTVSN